MAEQDRVNRVPGAGGDGAVDAETLSTLKTAIQDIAQRAELFSASRYSNERVRFNRWSGQSVDGRLHREDLGREPFPFEGASDQRVWSVDMLVQEEAMLRTAALARMQYRCEPVNGAADSKKAAKRTILLRWLLKRLGPSWLEEHIKLTNYEMQDSPAVALMRVYWKRETTLEMKTLTAEDLAGQWNQEFMARAQSMGVSVDQETMTASMDAFLQTLTDPEQGLDELATVVMLYFPRLTKARARKVVREIRDKGQAEFPVPAIAYEGPKVSARRFGEDFFVPDNMTEFDRAPFWFEPEWLSEAELRGRIGTDGWDKKWVEEVLKHEGEAIFPEYRPSEQGWLQETTADAHKGEYQVVWCWFQASNEDDVPARYFAVLHTCAEGTAFDRRIYRDSAHRWPGVFHRREVLDKWALNARGVAEIEGPAQGVVKLLRDLSTDNANIGALPPFVTFGHSNKGSLDLGPLQHLGLRQGGDAKFMQPPAFPAAARQVAEDIERERDRYWGRETEGSVPGAVQLRREYDLALFMERVRLELQMIMDMAILYMPDEMLVRVLDEAGDPVAKSMTELSGQFDVSVAFDPADLDVESVIKRVTAMRDVLMTIDRDKVIQATPVISYAFRILFPQLAGDALQQANAGQEQELLEEMKNYVALRAGATPPMVTDGTWNYQARLDMYDRMQAENPDVFMDMARDKREKLEQWLKFLQQQATQFGENVQIGQTGAAPAAGEQQTQGEVAE